MILQHFLAPLSNEFYFVVFSAVTGSAYVLIWVASLKRLIRPQAEVNYFSGSEGTEREFVEGIRGSRPLRQKRYDPRSAPARKRYQRRKRPSTAWTSAGAAY